jgi:hypothetical protein
MFIRVLYWTAGVLAWSFLTCASALVAARKRRCALSLLEPHQLEEVGHKPRHPWRDLVRQKSACS